MPVYNLLCSWLCRILRLLISYKFIVFLICVVSAVYLIWILLIGRSTLLPYQQKTDVKDMKGNIKYILLWSYKDYAPFYYFGTKREAFIRNNCQFTNCYVTDNRQFFGQDYSSFDAIAFNGRMSISRVRKKRSNHQKYIYFNTESSVHFPVTDNKFDDFFNWTSTYRLDSDIPYPYILIRNKKGDVVGPKINMEWENIDSEVSEDLDKILVNKTKAAVWFISSCDGKNKREILVEMLKEELKAYNLTIDVYGNCGTLTCSRQKQSECNRIVEKDYYFYLSLENSCAEYYVSEKLLVPLQNNAVPIVFGGANYSNYLPPGSYLNANQHSPKELAATMSLLINSPKMYRQFFKWKSHYTYHNPFSTENVCALCAALNNETKLEPSSYKDFRKWWNVDGSCENHLFELTSTIDKLH